MELRFSIIRFIGLYFCSWTILINLALFIYVLYLYMKQLNNNPSQVINSIPKNEYDVILSNEMKED